MKKRILIAAIAVCVVVAVVLMFARPGGRTDSLAIGVLMPMTGSGATWGQNGRKGIELALDEINKAGGVYGQPLTLMFEDTQSVPREAISAFRRVVDQYGVHLVIVDMISSDVLAVAPIAEEKKVVIISPGASNPAISQAGDFVFRNWPSDALQGELDARYAYEILGWRNAGILAIRNDYGEGLTKVFRTTFEDLGGQVVFADTFEQGASDFRALITRLREKNFGGIFLPGYPQEIPVLVRQLREQGVEAPLLGTESFEDPSVVSGAGPAIEGAHYSIPQPPDTSSGVVRQFRNSFRERFGEDPGVPADVAYDALYILTNAVAQVPKGLSGAVLAEAVRDQLYKLRNYEGASGVTTFDKNGDAVKPFKFKTIHNGQFVPAKYQLQDTEAKE